ncbi:MAG: LicD family protein [Sporichthyaceae bacterium]
MSDNEVRQVQLDALDAFVAHCHAAGIKYYLAYGTLLGAVRHKGFIPWDDDIDVMLGRADLRRLPATLPRSEGDGLLMVNRPGEDGWAYPFAKICDPRTEVSALHGDAQCHGVGIDIFPLDPVCRGRLRKPLHLGALASARRLYFLRCTAALRSGRAPWKALIYPLLKLIVHPVSQLRLAGIWNRAAQCGNGGPAEDLGVLVGSASWALPADAFGPGSSVSFEGRNLNAPQDWDRVLRRIYGDYYLTPPPPRARTSTHQVRSAWCDRRYYADDGSRDHSDHPG